jgi:hypothetical protein
VNRVSSPRLVVRTVFSLAIFLVLGLAAAGAAMAETVKFSSTGEEQTFRVPAGVTSIHVVATGGQGGAGTGNSRSPGFGATATGDLQVSPLQLLFVEVGGNGGAATGSTGGTGGFNGGAAGGSSGDTGGPGGGGGGGASDVRLVQRSVGNTLESRLITAGGGGGVGGGAEGGPGGSGATSGIGEGGTTGGPGAHSAPGVGGTGATTSAPGGNGSLGNGGVGANAANLVLGGGGGGGGGGVFGGGGGGNGGGGGENGGGGGAGSSAFGSSIKGTSITKDTSGVPSITITYTLPPTNGAGGGGTGNGNGNGNNGTGGGGGALDTTIDAHPAKLIETRKEKVRVRFRFSATQQVSGFLCKLDAAAFEPCGAPKRYRVAKGFHTFKVKAVGDSTPAVFSFRVKPKS